MVKYIGVKDIEIVDMSVSDIIKKYTHIKKARSATKIISPMKKARSAKKIISHIKKARTYGKGAKRNQELFKRNQDQSHI